MTTRGSSDGGDYLLRRPSIARPTDCTILAALAVATVLIVLL